MFPWQQKITTWQQCETHISQTKHPEQGSLDDDLDVLTPYVTYLKKYF